MQLKNFMHFIDRFWEEGLLAAVWIAILVFSVFDFNSHFIHSEKLTLSQHLINLSGTHWQSADWYIAWGHGFESTGRNRFWSWLFHSFDTKFRYWLFDRIPFHPSISLVWLFSLLLTPWLLFRGVAIAFGSRSVGARAAAFYLVSIGFLSCVTQYFWAAKPMTDFFIILVFYLCVKLQGDFVKENTLSRAWLCLLVATLTFGAYFDETYFAVFIFVPVWVFSLLQNPRTRVAMLLLWLAPFGLFCIAITWLWPNLFRYLNLLNDYSFWHYAIGSNHELLLNPFRRVFSVIQAAVFSHIAYFSWLGQTMEFPLKLFGGIVVFWGVFFTLTRRQWRRHTALITQFAICLVAWVFMQSLVLTKREEYLYNCYYWGCMASIFFAVLLAALLDWYENVFWRWAGRVVFLLLLINSFCLFENENKKQMSHFYNDSIGKFVQQRLALQQNDASIDFSLVKKVWLARRDPQEVERLLRGAPVRGVWLFSMASMYWPPEQRAGLDLDPPLLLPLR